MILRRLAAVAAAGVLTGAGLFLTPGTAQAYRNPPPKSHRIGRPAVHLIHAHGFVHGFWDYDRDSTKVDNPVTIVFVSRHPDMVDRVYDQLDAVGIDSGGSKMTLAGYGGSRPGVSSTDSWHSHSAGRKGAFGCWGHCGNKTDIHVRTYGPDGKNGTQVYQGSAGYAPYYLVATVHFDVDENTSRATFGYNDRARDTLIAHMTARHTWTVKATVDIPRSSCYGWFDSSHFCDSDGRAKVVSID